MRMVLITATPPMRLTSALADKAAALSCEASAQARWYQVTTGTSWLSKTVGLVMLGSAEAEVVGATAAHSAAALAGSISAVWQSSVWQSSVRQSSVWQSSV